MSDLVRECYLCPVMIVLQRIDIDDYRLSVNDPDTGYFREWHVGTSIARAIECYDLAVAFVHRRHAMAEVR